jgi:hypothetical protein
MRDKLRQYVRGIGMWIRHGPSRLLAGLAGRTTLPEGFWLVLLLSMGAGAVSAAVAVVLAFGYANRPSPPRRVD